VRRKKEQCRIWINLEQLRNLEEKKKKKCIHYACYCKFRIIIESVYEFRYIITMQNSFFVVAEHDAHIT